MNSLIMRWWLFFCILPTLLYAQLSEDFSDSNFSVNPTWVGEIDKFRVTADKKLQLYDATKSKRAYLVTSNHISENVCWEFNYEYGANPSSSNYASVYLVSNKANLNESLNGYYLTIGKESGTTDKISLYKQTGTTKKLIFSSESGSALNARGSISIKLKVTRDDKGNWKIYADKEGKDNLTLLGAFYENSFNTTKYFGIYIKFSSTKNQHYFFDNFKITKVDYTAPIVTNATIFDVNQIQVSFSENITLNSANRTQNYKLIPDIGNPNYIQFDGNSTALLVFDKPLQDGILYSLNIQNIKDLAKNIIDNTTIGNMSYQIPQPKVVSYQILSPNFIQINFSHALNKNLDKTKNNFRLNGEIISTYNWSANATQITLKVKTMQHNTLYQLSIANLTSQKHKNFPVKTISNTIIPIQTKMIKPFIKKIDIDAKNIISIQFSQLMNKRQVEDIENYNLQDTSILNATYSRNTDILYLKTFDLMPDRTYSIYIKKLQAATKNGFSGFFTEPVNTNILFKIVQTKLMKTSIESNRSIVFEFNNIVNVTAENINLQGIKPYQIDIVDKKVKATWKSSIKCNQTYQIKLFDITSPDQKGIPISKFDTVFNISHFLEPLEILNTSIIEDSTLKIECNKDIDNQTATDISLYQINEIHPYKASVEAKTITLYFYQPFANRDYTLYIRDIKPREEKGFLRQNISDVKIIFSNYTANANDIILNEILFEPKTGGSEFIEIYNRSDKHINLKGYTLCNFEVQNNDTTFKNKKLLPYILMKPQSYLVFTKDKNRLVSLYPSANYQSVIALKSMPYLPNEEGKIAILGKNQILLDKFHYHKNMHFVFHNQQDRVGISLERIHFTSHHWQSAIQNDGGASPTLKNSNFTTLFQGDKTIMLSKKIFSPNEDTLDDILQIRYNFKTSGNMATVKILNDLGVLKKTLVQNENLPQNGNWIWNGTDEFGVKLPQGFYIIIVEITNTDGSKKIFEEVCVLSY